MEKISVHVLIWLLTLDKCKIFGTQKTERRSAA